MRRRDLRQTVHAVRRTMAAATVGRAQTRDAARTPWGDPDLEGTWTNATLTPLQRPPELGAKSVLHARRGGDLGQAAGASRPTPTVRGGPVKSGRTTTRSSSEARAA